MFEQFLNIRDDSQFLQVGISINGIAKCTLNCTYCQPN